MFRIMVVCLLLFVLVGQGFTGVPYPEDLWKGLIGEAVGEGYEGMYAVACVYRNRLEKGLPLGCVALRRRDLDEFVRKQGKKFEYMAKDIIEEVFEQNGKDVTGGATHYENIKRFGIPWWAKTMVRTFRLGNHTFFGRLRKDS